MTFTNTLLGQPVETQSGASSGVRPSVQLIGAKANRCLSTPGFSGQVIAAGTRSAYIITTNGNIIAACRMDQQPHPRSLLTDIDLTTIQVGLRTWIEGTDLHFSNGATLSLRNRRLWVRNTAAESRPAPIHVLQARCRELLKMASDLHQGDNLGLAIPFFTTINDATDPSDPPNYTSPLVDDGVRQIRKLLPICRVGDLESALQLADQLIGLGPGLTPSGDDFTGGLIFMARHLNAAYPEERWWKAGDVSGLLARSESMTNKISHALLTDLAEGQSHASLHTLADALVSHPTLAAGFDVRSHVRSVTEIGHSSGWDMLSGMLAGLLPVIYRARYHFFR